MCYELNVYVSPNSYILALIPNVMVTRGIFQES